jgi:hypothetical protein
MDKEARKEHPQPRVLLLGCICRFSKRTIGDLAHESPPRPRVARRASNLEVQPCCEAIA